MFRDRVLLICLKPEESACIRQLLSSFEIEVASEDLSSLEKIVALPDGGSGICLAVLRADDGRRMDQEIRQIRHHLRQSVPILILIPPEQTTRIREYLRSGADDYWVLPLDETAFPVRFYILLEYGQAIIHTRSPEETIAEQSRTEPSLLQRLLNRFQDGLRFFSPGLLTSHRQESPIFNKWEKVRQLGGGGFGEVWLVRERGKKALAVAKMPFSPEMNVRTLRAAAILKRLSLHPNVVHLVEVLKEGGRVILIQEYVPGHTLQALLGQEIGTVQKEKIFRQLLSVAAHAHQHRIMHRDIKPENIIITPSGDLKLLDFGIAKDLSRRSVSATVAGSRPFMAPEQILGRSCIASDVWSLGVILYLFSTGSLPFYDPNEKYLMDAILEAPPLSPRQLAPILPRQLEKIILKCLEKDPARRYADAGVLCLDLLKAYPDFGKGKVLPKG